MALTKVRGKGVDGGTISTETAGTNNLILGSTAGDSIASGGNYNVCVGDTAGTAITTGDNNTAVGFEALSTEDANGNNTAVGYRALKTLNAGAEGYNTAVGQDAGLSITTGVQNTLMGSGAGDALTDADDNVAIGRTALTSDTQGSRSVAIGTGTLQTQNHTSAANVNNIAIGYQAGGAITTGQHNVLIGSLAGDAMTDAANCVAIGLSAMTTNTRGNKVVAVGVGAARNFNYSSGNSDMNSVYVGHNAGEQVTVGGNNVIIGAGACANAAGITGGADLTTGNNHVVIGKDAAVSAADADAQVVLGFECVGASNTSLTFGKSATDSNIDFGATSITAPSDERYKENIETSTAGLGFINDLRPVTYKWKKAKDIPSDHRAYIEEGKDGAEDRVMERGDDLYHGFIAQEIKVALDKHSEVKNYKELWREDDDGRQRVGPAFLIPMLVKSIQELSAKNDALEARIKKLEDG